MPLGGDHGTHPDPFFYHLYFFLPINPTMWKGLRFTPPSLQRFPLIDIYCFSIAHPCIRTFWFCIHCFVGHTFRWNFVSLFTAYLTEMWVKMLLICLPPRHQSAEKNAVTNIHLHIHENYFCCCFCNNFLVLFNIPAKHICIWIVGCEWMDAGGISICKKKKWIQNQKSCSKFIHL